jgi:hypothetical protein
VLTAVVGVLGVAGVGGVGIAAAQDQPATQPKRPARGLPPKPAPAAPPETPPPAPSDPNAPAAQPAAPSAPSATPATPTAPAAAAAPGGKWQEPPKVGPYIKQDRPRDLTLTVDVRLHMDNNLQKQTYRDPLSGKSVDMPVITPMEFNTLGFVFPLVPHTASTDLFVDQYIGVLRINGNVATEKYRVLSGYPAGTKLAVWDTGSPDSTAEARQVELHVEMPERCYNTIFDEKAAMEVNWPTMAWPTEVATCLLPQLYVEAGVDEHGQVRMYEDKAVKQAMKEIFEDKGMKDLTRVPPVRVAKMITEKVWGSVQMSGEGLLFMRTGEFSGMDLQSPSHTLELGKGSEHDVTVLMCALLRKAGLPTRTVIGFDINTKEERFLERGNKNNKLRSWVEFALYDEAKNTLNWVPIDVAKMRKVSSRPIPIDRNWQYFGTHDELDKMPVMALHFHPPTDVVAYGAPAFWGWFVTPKPADNAEQALRFMATTSSTRGGEDPKNPAPKDEKKPKRGY